MVLGFKKPKYSPIAVDLGADSLKLLQVVPTNPPQLLAAAASVVPDHARGNIAQRMRFVKEALKNLLEIQNFKGKKAILSIPAFQTMVLNLELPINAQDNLEFEVGLQIQQKLNIDSNRMVIRYFPVKNTAKNGVGKIDVICIAAMKDIVMQYIDIASRCKLDVVGMYSEPLSILKAFESIKTNSIEENNICYVDIGSNTTKIVISQNGKLVFSKLVYVAGYHFNKAISHYYKISHNEARQARVVQASGVDLDTAVCNLQNQNSSNEKVLDCSLEKNVLSTKRDIETKSHLNSRNDVIGEIEDCLKDEMNICFRQYNALFSEHPIDRIVFLGGESHHKYICQSIAESTQIAAQLGDPFARLARIGLKNKPIGVDLNIPQPGWTVAMGLCFSDSNY